MTLNPPRLSKSAARRIASKAKGPSTLVAYCGLETQLRKVVEDFFETSHPAHQDDAWKMRIELPTSTNPQTLGGILRELAEVSDRIDHAQGMHHWLEADYGLPIDPVVLFPHLAAEAAR